MPGEHETDYELKLSPIDRLRIRFKTKSRVGRTAELLEFAVVFRSLIEGQWRDIRRYDNAHGRPHVHLYDWKGETANDKLGEYEDCAKILKAAREEIKRDFKEIRERFIATKR